MSIFEQMNPEIRILMPILKHHIDDFTRYFGNQISGEEMADRAGYSPDAIPPLLVAANGKLYEIPLRCREIIFLKNQGLIASVPLN